MTFDIRRLSPEIPLRLGIGILYVYTGLTLWQHPESWHWAIDALPIGLRYGVQHYIGEINFLKAQSVVELLVAASMLLWFLPRIVFRVASVFVALQMAVILLLVGVRDDTFRDIAILAGGASLFLMSFRGRSNT